MQLADEDISTREILDWQGVHLFHFSGSSCSQKTRIFLALKGIEWESHPVNLATQQNYTPWFLGINPRGLVPVLVHDGAVHIESNDILEYLDDHFEGPRLIPKDQRQAVIGSLAEEDGLHEDIRNISMRFVFPAFIAAKKPDALETFANDTGTIAGEPDAHKAHELEYWTEFAKHGVTDLQARQSADRFRKVYSRFDAILEESEYLAGETLTLMDIAWFIYASRLSAGGYPFSRLHPNVHRWYQKLMRREEFAREAKSPLPVRLVTAALHLGQKLKGTTLERVVGF